MFNGNLMLIIWVWSILFNSSCWCLVMRVTHRQRARRLKREPCEMDTIAWSLRENFCYTDNWVEIKDDQTLEVSDDLNKMAKLQPYRECWQEGGERLSQTDTSVFPLAESKTQATQQFLGCFARNTKRRPLCFTNAHGGKKALWR